MFIGVSSPDLVSPEMVKRMARSPIVFAIANPNPEIAVDAALEAGAAIACDGRSLNNALAFPGLLRGALDARARHIDEAMEQAAAEFIAGHIHKHEVVPDFMHREYHRRLAEAVRDAAVRSGAARVPS